MLVKYENDTCLGLGIFSHVGIISNLGSLPLTFPSSKSSRKMNKI